ncbi:reverse transcriptase domain-containing protein [Tanacetum coccineum]
MPTRSNLVQRGVSLDSSSCPLCDSSEEDTHHVLFRCSLAQAILRRVCRWWDLEWHPWISFLDWQVWLSAIRVSAKVKSLLEGVFYMAWWSIWNLRNRTIFDDIPPRRSTVFDDIVSLSFSWCHSRCNRSPSPKSRPRKEGGVFDGLGGKERSASARSSSRHQSSHGKETEVQPRKYHHKGTSSQGTSGHSESEDSEGGHWKSKSMRRRSNTYEDDLSQPWTCKERNPFTPRIWHFNFPRTRMPSHVKTYNGSGDPDDHIKLFQVAAKIERWAMPTWCHMFNSTLTGNARVWFDKLPRESIDSYEDLRTTFRENYLQQTKHIKDPMEIHHIKQRDGESTEDFMERYKAEILDMEGAPECMKISGFMHGITHPELIKHLYERIPKSVDEMYKMTTSFLQGEVAAFSHSRKKAPTPWKQPEGGNKPNFKKGFKNKQRLDQKPDRFSLLTKTPK